MNVITAIINLIKDPVIELGNYYNSKNRANSEGDSLEEYVKDLYAGTLREEDEQKRLEKLSEVFSYFGNNSNPPDAILKNGDVIEVKKLESATGQIQLNSSHPNCKLNSSSSMISQRCKEIENGEWEKDVLYVVGHVNKKKLHALFMVYGMDYVASEDVYLRLKDNIKEGLKGIPNIELTETKEVGRINHVDPLGITDLRIRGMWLLQNPWKTFTYINKFKLDKTKKFNFCAIINKDKYHSYSEYKDLENLENIYSDLNISDVKIKNPNNPAELIDAKMIKFTI